MDIQIEGLTLGVRIGVHPWEQTIVQQLLFDITCPCPDDAGSADDLATTLDYATLAAALADFVAGRAWQLLETLHRDVAAFLQEKFSLTRLYLRIEKPFALRQARKVAVVAQYHFPTSSPGEAA